jgi:hypothetical protein
VDLFTAVKERAEYDVVLAYFFGISGISARKERANAPQVKIASLWVKT